MGEPKYMTRDEIIARLVELRVPIKQAVASADLIAKALGDGKIGD